MRHMRILAIVLALLLALPIAAGAEGASFTLKLSDPVLTITEDGLATTQDFTGVAAQLGGVVSGSGEGLMSLALFAQDSPAITAMVGLSGDQLYALVSGLTNVLTLPMSQIEEALSESADLAELSGQISAITDFSAMLENIEFTEGPAEKVQFYDSEGECPRFSAHLSGAELAALSSDLPKNMSVDLSYFTDGGDNVRVEGTVNHLFDEDDADEANLDFVLVAKEQSGYPVGAIWFGNSEIEADINFVSGASESFPDHAQFEFVADIAEVDGDSDDESVQIQLNVTPAATEDGSMATMLDAAVIVGEQLAGSMQWLLHSTDTAESYEFYVFDASGDCIASAVYEGNIEANGAGSVHSGLLSLFYVDGDDRMDLEVHASLDLSSDIEGKLPDISGMPQLRFDEITEEQLTQLTSEAQQLVITVMGQFMAVPSVAAIIASAMQ